MSQATCEKCGSKVSDKYHFCDNCGTPISSPTTQRRGIRDRLRTTLGSLNKHEKYYGLLFLLSMFLGAAYGSFDKTIYIIAREQLPKSPTILDIFLHNITVDLISTLTGGVFGIISNIVTYSIFPGMFENAFADRGMSFVGVIAAIIAIVITLVVVFATYGALEMVGHFCFGLVGFTFLERLVWKEKTNLRRVNILILGTVLMLAAAVIEWFLGMMLTGLSAS
jgi:hypothetical protein